MGMKLVQLYEVYDAANSNCKGFIVKATNAEDAADLVKEYIRREVVGVSEINIKLHQVYSLEEGKVV